MSAHVGVAFLHISNSGARQFHLAWNVGQTVEDQDGQSLAGTNYDPNPPLHANTLKIMVEPWHMQLGARSMNKASSGGVHSW